MDLSHYPLHDIAARVGTPFYLYDGDILKHLLGDLASLTRGEHLQSRYAMKANSSHKVLQAAKDAGLWIDAVSGNEVLRAKRAGFAMGSEPPVVMLTTDVFRDNGLQVVLDEGVLPNVGSEGMIGELKSAGYDGPIAIRVNPGFGHGHVQSCDTGGPSSKHGIWFEDMGAALDSAKQHGLKVTALHAHVGTGPQPGEFETNMGRLVDLFAELLERLPDVDGVNLGGGIPHPYKPEGLRLDFAAFHELLTGAQHQLSRAAGRTIRLEIEPGRYGVAGMGVLVSRVKDVKATRANEKGPGNEFIMVDAGFNDLVRPAMYGSYHQISIVGPADDAPREPFVVAGPLCESGDVFTRDDQELLQPRDLPRPEPGDLLVLHDAGAYGAAMSSNYVSMGRAAQVYWEGGKASLISRRETVENLVRLECDEALTIA